MTTNAIPSVMHAIHDGTAAHAAFTAIGMHLTYGTADWSVITYVRSVNAGAQLAICDDESGDNVNWAICLATVDDDQGETVVTTLRDCLTWQQAAEAAAAMLAGFDSVRCVGLYN